MPAVAASLASQQVAEIRSPANVDFFKLLTGGMQDVSDKVSNADQIAREFTLSDNVPLHQVTYALEQARLAMSVMMQVRNRLVESYQQLMNMQL